MKGTYLGEFQEVVLLTVAILNEDAYGVKIQEEIQDELGRSISRGALHAALVRLEDKGFLKSEMGQASSERGGRRKRIYTVTSTGKETLHNIRDMREQLWNRVTGWSLNSSYALLWTM